MRSLSILTPILILASCAVGPDYQVPTGKLEVSFKNAGFQATPPVGNWWTVFQDPQLNRLMRQAAANNPQARAALARYDQARTELGLAKSDRFPAVTADALAQRGRDSASTNREDSGKTENDYRAALNLSWEIDLWGRVRRNIAAAAANEQAASYDYQAAITSLKGEVARTYFSLRSADAEIGLLGQTAALRQEALRLMTLRNEAGDTSRLDVQRASTEYERVRTELAQIRIRRGQLENALGTLIGQGASSFRLAAKSSTFIIPDVPGGAPADLLRRRPDLAAAERRLAAASETIGFAIASYLPRLDLVGIGGLQSVQAADFFNSGSRLWTLGPEVFVPIFQGGRLFADKNKAEALYREALENYRDTLLTAIRETEDSLLATRELRSAAASSDRGSSSARAAAKLIRSRYTGGIASYFEVVDAERTALFEEREALDIRLDQALATTRLIQALGGGWTSN